MDSFEGQGLEFISNRIIDPLLRVRVMYSYDTEPFGRNQQRSPSRSDCPMQQAKRGSKQGNRLDPVACTSRFQSTEEIVNELQVSEKTE